MGSRSIDLLPIFIRAYMLIHSIVLYTEVDKVE